MNFWNSLTLKRSPSQDAVEDKEPSPNNANVSETPRNDVPVPNRGPIFDVPKDALSIPRRAENQNDNCWSQPDACSFRVRGANYLNDRIKVAGDFAYHLVGVDLVTADQPIEHWASKPGNLISIVNKIHAEKQKKAEKPQEDQKVQASQKQKQKKSQDDEEEGGVDLDGSNPDPTKPPFIFLVNFIMPWGHFLAYFSPGHSSPFVGDPHFDKLMLDFISKDDDFRNARFKIIPRMVEGNWAVKKIMGDNTPAILGTKMTVKYFRGDNYFEVDVDLTSSKIARGILGTVKTYVKSVVIDLALILEGQSEEELPERLLGALRFYRLDLDNLLSADTVAKLRKHLL